MKRTKAVMSVPVLCVLLLMSLAGCSGEVTPPPAQASGQTTAAQGAYELRSDTGIDVLYFQTSDPCECMAEVGVAVRNAVNTHFAQELQSGELRFFVIYSDDWSNRATFEMFKNQPFDLFIVEVENGRGLATPLYELWGVMGDAEAIDLYVREHIEQSLAGLA